MNYAIITDNNRVVIKVEGVKDNKISETSFVK